MVAGELVSCLLEKTSLQLGQHQWAVFEIVAGGELGNELRYSHTVQLSLIILSCDVNFVAVT